MLEKSLVVLVLNSFINDSRVLKECISLQKQGYNVKVIALHDYHLKEYETIQDIFVHRIKLKTRRWSKLKLVQLIKYIEFIYKVIRNYKFADFIHCNDLNTLPISVIVKCFFNKKAKIIYDAHEYETERSGMGRFQKLFSKVLEKILIKYADRVITVSDSIADEYVQLYGIKRPAVVLNTPPFQNVAKKNIFRTTLGISQDQVIFLYQGGFDKGRGIEILLDTFKNLGSKYVIIFMGYGPLELQIREYSKRYNNIYFHPAVSPDILLDYTASADFGFLLYENNCLSHYYCSPNKVFEYIMAGIPVIVSNLYEMKKLVEQNNIGLVVEDNTPECLMRTISIAADINIDNFKNNLTRLKKIYNWETQEEILLKLYNFL